jgi:hypothetical protein
MAASVHPATSSLITVATCSLNQHALDFDGKHLSCASNEEMKLIEEEFDEKVTSNVSSNPSRLQRREVASYALDLSWRSRKSLTCPRSS